METLTNSRIITYPDLFEKTSSYTIILVDPTEDELTDVSLFCMSSVRNYDIYVYPGNQGHLEWLSEASNRADQMLINNISQVTSSTGHRYGLGLDIASPLEFFQKVDQLSDL